MKKLPLFVIVVALCIACASSRPVPARVEIPENQMAHWTRIGGVPADGFFRYHDADKRVTCWMVRDSHGEGIGLGLSCLPDHMLEEKH